MKTLFVPALLLAAACGTAQAGLTTVNFDGAVDTDIGTDHPGLSFNAGLAATGPVRTWAFSGADTPGNVLGLAGGFLLNQADGQAIDVVFAAPVQQVSVRALFSTAIEIYARDATASLPFMAVYSTPVASAASRLATVMFDAADPCLQANSFCTSGWDGLDYLSSSANIQSIRLSAFAPGGAVMRRAAFDTLVYGTPGGDGDGGGGNPVSAPGTAALAGLALAALSVTQRRRRPFRT